MKKDGHKDLRQWAELARSNSHSPYSKVQVGAALECEDGKIFAGCNVENCSFGGTVCAERVAIFKAVSEGQRRFKRIYILTQEGWPPCGLCRQVMSEFMGPGFEVIVADMKGMEKKYDLKDILPLAFTPESLKI